MGKALVIKNADFSANKVGTITFDIDIPCTGVSFSSSSIELSELGVASIGYTLTPTNTTDVVTIVSSDSSVVEVSGTEMNVVGIGTCTLTISCGSYSDQCDVTVAITENPIFTTAYAAVQQKDGSDIKGCVLSGSGKRITCAKYLSDTDFSNELFQVAPNGVIPVNEHFAPIPIPENTTTIHISADTLYNGNHHSIVFFENTDNTFIQNQNTYTEILSVMDIPYTTNAGKTSINADITVPNGAKGYVITLRQYPDYNTAFDNCVTEADVKAVVDNTFHVSIDYSAE